MRRHPTPSPEARPLPDLPALRILLAEDNIINQIVTGEMLQAFGHAVVLAKSGREVLDTLARQQIDVALIDVHLPEVDALEITAAIRGRERGTPKYQPLIAMTARAMKGDRERCLSAGVDSYLVKPIVPTELLEALAAVQPLVRDQRSLWTSMQAKLDGIEVAVDERRREDKP